jgi:MFS family permease
MDTMRASENTRAGTTRATDATRTALRFINVAHLLDHLFMLIFPTAVIAMTTEFGLSYGEMIGLALGGFVAFGAGSLPAGWLGDHWNRRHLMAIFFLGIGGASVLTGFARDPWQIAAGLTLIGLFAAIYHPVGTAIVVAFGERMGKALAINSVYGNLGVAFAALVTGAITQWLGWRAAFFIPGAVAIATGLAFVLAVPRDLPAKKKGAGHVVAPRSVVIRAFAVLVAVTVAGGIIFNSATVSLPKVVDEEVRALAGSPLGIGVLAAAIYLCGAAAQVIVGHWLDRHRLRDVFVPLAALQVACLVAAVWASEWWVVLAAVGVMFVVYGQVIINDAMVAKYTSDEWRARAYSVRYLVSFGAAALAVPLIAYTQASGGFPRLFAVLAVLSAVVLGGALAFPRSEPGRETVGGGRVTTADSARGAGGSSNR